MAEIFSKKRIDRFRKITKDHFLPDVAQVFKPARPGSGAGFQDKYTQVLYEGGKYIPCRIDSAARYRDNSVWRQEILANESEIHFPFDFDIQADWEIRVNGKVYHPLKLWTDITYDVTRAVTCYSISPETAVIIFDNVDNFTYEITGTAVTFTPVRTDMISYLWLFGDGEGAATTSPTHDYEVSGTFTVTLQQMDAERQVIKTTQKVVIP